ncbi:MAG: hypothetical protein MI975_16480 [Cytophagales bacterium]|nr:hypothetical protein [Cytophagales bacterium]
MKKVILTSVFIFKLAAASIAQDAIFSVILNRGNNLIKTEKNQKTIVLGSGLMNHEVVHVSENGYIALVHEVSGSSLEITEAGDYKVSELEVRLKERPATILAKYGRFLMKKLNPDENGNQNLNVTGAVERGDVGLIEVDLPKINDLFGDQVTVSWKQTDDILDYVVTIKDKLDDLIVEKPVTGTSYTIDLNGGQLKGERMIIVNVRARHNSELRSPDFGIKRLDLEESEVIRNEFASIKMVANANNVVDKLLIASFFEENQLLADAITYYNEAQSISPDPDGFNTLYNNFLIRNGLKN